MIIFFLLSCPAHAGLVLQAAQTAIHSGQPYSFCFSTAFIPLRF